MDTITIVIEMGNSAFDDHYNGGAEVARILHKLADTIQRSDPMSAIGDRLFDSNGNVCGAVMGKIKGVPTFSA